MPRWVRIGSRCTTPMECCSAGRDIRVADGAGGLAATGAEFPVAAIALALMLLVAEVWRSDAARAPSEIDGVRGSTRAPHRSRLGWGILVPQCRCRRLDS